MDKLESLDELRKEAGVPASEFIHKPTSLTTHGAGFGRYRRTFGIAHLTSAQEYMQPITDSARGMVNTVYDTLLNGKK